MILACQNISKAFGTDQILSDVSFHIEDQEKMAIVGINGSGKTTLLRIIMGEEQPDSGQIVLSKDRTIGYLSQHQDISFDNTIYAEMLLTKQKLIDCEQQMRKLEASMKHSSACELEQIMEAYNRLSAYFERENGYAYQSEISGVLKGLGFDKSDYDRHINTLSGGQKMRIALGRLLLTKPDLIILDEPTNHLDMDSVKWLEGFLASYGGSVIIVSHDRYFIDRIATKIVELDQTKATVYSGNYTYYAKKRADIRASMLKAYQNQQQEIKHQEAVIAKLKQFNREKSIKRAESREKMLDKIEVLQKPTEAASEMRLTLSPSVESGNDVLTVKGLSKKYNNNVLFDNLDFSIKRGEHVALIGSNGTGKTTILKMINHIVSKDSGSIALGSRVKIGYYDQEHHVLSLHKTIFEEISDSYPDLSNTRIRNVLAAFLFTGDDVFKQISDLSGGERGRVSLAKLMLSPANFLILDEPTNHLDIQSKEILECALREYTGTLFIVSHDRYFINTVATRIYELRNKQLYNFIGNYDYYDSHKEIIYQSDCKPSTSKLGFTDITQKDAANTDGNDTSGKDAYMRTKEQQAKQRKLDNDIKKCEKQIEELEEKLKLLDEEICLPENATNSSKLSELSGKRQELEYTIESIYEAWEALMSQ